MKFLGLDNVVCLSPHPDDTEYSMAGTIAKSTETRFHILCMSRGGAPGFDKTNVNDRRQDVVSFCDKMGSKNVIVDFPDCDFLTDKTEPEWINYIENRYFQNVSFPNYGLMVPPLQDSQFEHRFVNQFGYGLIRSKCISLFEYQTVSTLSEWTPNLSVDIWDTYNQKMDALDKFTSQKDKPIFQWGVLESFHSDYRLKRRNVEFSEKFKIMECFV